MTAPKPEKRETSELPLINVTERHEMELALSLDPDTMDPNRHYRWVQDSGVRIAKHRAKGYTIERKSESGVVPLVEVDDAADGTIRVGDTVLMSCPKDKYDARKRSQEELSLQRAQKATKAAKRKAREIARKTPYARVVPSRFEPGN